MKKIYLSGSIVLLLLILPYSVLLLQSTKQAANYTREDGIIENLSALFFFMAALVVLYLFFKLKSDEKIYFPETKRNYFFLLLGLLFLFCFGEEISWGQRIFNVKTSDFMMKINMQSETNLHNLCFFQAYNKTMIGWWMTPHGIFALIWLFYCVLIPLVNKFSLKVHNIIGKINFPVIPLWIGILFIMNHIISKIFEKMVLFTDHQPIVEIKETNFAFLFFLASISLYTIHINKSPYRRSL